MKHLFSVIAKYLPLVLGLAILAVAAPLVPWHKVLPYRKDLSPIVLLLLIIGSGFYYLGRIIRYWLLLRFLDHPARFGKVAIACLVAQPVAVLPAGELYRASMLRRYANVSMSHGAPGVFAQSVAESVGLLLIALAGVTVVHRYLAIVVVIAIIFGGLLAYIRWHNVRTSRHLMNYLPGVNVNHSWLRSFLGKNRTLLSGWNFVALIAASLISTGAGIGMLLVTSRAFGGHLTLFQAAVAYALPVVLEAVSFLPGGLGINENSSVAILTLFKLGLPRAVAVTVIMRLFTLGIGFVYGFAAMGWASLRHYRRYD